MRALVLALALVAIGCAPSLPASYKCASDAQCRFNGQAGRCEASGAWRVPASACADGRRDGQVAPPRLAGACVDAVNGDGGGGIGGGGGGGGSAGGGGGGGGGSGATHITRVGTGSVPNGARSSVTLPAPSGVAPGDFVVACIVVDTAQATISAPTGFTLHQDLRDTLSGEFHAGYFTHVAAAGDPATWTFTLSMSTNVTAADVAYRNVDTSAPIDVSSNKVFEGMTFLAPSITT